MLYNSLPCKNFLFIHIPRTAGSSVEIKLGSGGESIKDDFMGLANYNRLNLVAIYPDDSGLKSPNHKRLDYYNNKFNIDDYYKFTIVRNPWDKLLSAFTFMNKTRKFKWGSNWEEKDFRDNFNTWVKVVSDVKMFTDSDGNLTHNSIDDRNSIFYGARKQHPYLWCKDQYKYLTIDGEMKMDYICRFENLEEDISNVYDELDIADKTLPWINKTAHPYYTEVYNDDIRKLVTKMCAKDIEYFGYKFGD